MNVEMISNRKVKVNETACIVEYSSI